MPDALMATFTSSAQARAAVTALLEAGFLNVAEEQDGPDSLVIVDPGSRAVEARRIFTTNGGVEL